MKTALLPQNDNLVIDSLKENVGRSVFDLSHSTTFPIDVDGAILPICCIETVPSDSFEISVECLLRQLSPLKVPLMANFKLNTAFYYCQNRLAWKKWERFISGGRSGNEVYDIPRVSNVIFTKASNPNKYLLADTTYSEGVSKINYKNSLHTYFGISMNVNLPQNAGYDDTDDYSDELPIAFPFYDYQMICRDYYTDIDRLPANPLTGNQFRDFDNIDSDWAYSNLFPPDDDEIRLKDGIQLQSGFQSGDDTDINIHGFILDKIRYHNVRPDYFTLTKPAPMRGDVPEIDTTVAVSQVDFTKAISRPLGHNYNDNFTTLAADKLTRNDITPTPDNTLYKIQAVSDNDYSSDGNETLLKALNQAEISLETTKAINAAELRLLSQLTIWKELNILHKPYYNDFLNAHFNSVKVGESAVEKPQYIGGTSQNISINEILQTSQSTETSPLGNQGATAMSLANNYVGKVYCNDYGYIIGVAYIQTDMLYNPAMPRSFSRRTKEDFYSPEFANLSMQATLNKEIFFSNDEEWNNQAWGYTGCFDELRSIPNKVAGDLLNSSYTDLKKWVIRREFNNSNKPAMTSKFLALKGNVDKTAWQVPTMPAFMLQCANYVKGVRPLPYVAIPKAL